MTQFEILKSMLTFILDKTSENLDKTKERINDLKDNGKTVEELTESIRQHGFSDGYAKALSEVSEHINSLIDKL